ncbi:hypothetical protein AAG906_032901 [Vitis piasezkii]
MLISKQPNLFLVLLFTLLFAAYFTQGSKSQVVPPYHQREIVHLQGSGEQWMNRNSRRLMIGSTRPTCTYNECRGCKYKCRAEQVPVEGNDPINSAYHYRCVCHSQKSAAAFVFFYHSIVTPRRTNTTSLTQPNFPVEMVLEITQRELKMRLNWKNSMIADLRE